MAGSAEPEKALHSDRQGDKSDRPDRPDNKHQEADSGSNSLVVDTKAIAEPVVVHDTSSALLRGTPAAVVVGSIGRVERMGKPKADQEPGIVGVNKNSYTGSGLGEVLIVVESVSEVERPWVDEMDFHAQYPQASWWIER